MAPVETEGNLSAEVWTIGFELVCRAAATATQSAAEYLEYTAVGLDIAVATTVLASEVVFVAGRVNLGP